MLPNLVGKTADAAQTIAAKDHFLLDASQSAASNQYPAGQIISQDVPAGTAIDPAANMTVHAIVSTGGGAAVVAPAGNAAVPDVRGRPYADALTTLKGASLTWTVVYNVQKSGNGTIVGEEPAPGTPSTGSVTLTLSVPGEVPDVQNTTIDQARAILESNGYLIKGFEYTTIEGADGNVVRTVPEAGTGLTPGSSVTLVVNGTQP